MTWSKHFSLFKSWDEQNLQKWHKIKKRGLLFFLLIEGIAKWGLVSLCIFLLVSAISNGLTMQKMMLTGSVWLVMSLLYGFVIWKGTECYYRACTSSSL